MFENIIVEVNNMTENHIVQEILFKLGFEWFDGGPVLMSYVDTTHIVTDGDKKIMYNNSGCPPECGFDDFISFEEFINQLENEIHN